MYACFVGIPKFLKYKWHHKRIILAFSREQKNACTIFIRVTVLFSLSAETEKDG